MDGVFKTGGEEIGKERRRGFNFPYIKRARIVPRSKKLYQDSNPPSRVEELFQRNPSLPQD
jgi:hypothetical protein